jgi:predicted RNA binding protein YcfA (HicA-like mRNA interferase family)
LKRKELIRTLNEHECELQRHGSRHDIYVNTKSGKRAPVPRHNEIADSLVRIIIKQLGIEK